MNNILKRVCKLNRFGFIDNSKMCAENLFEMVYTETMIVR